MSCLLLLIDSRWTLHDRYVLQSRRIGNWPLLQDRRDGDAGEDSEVLDVLAADRLRKSHQTRLLK